MTESSFDAFVRRAADALDRRSVLGALGVAALAAVLSPLQAGANKPSKKKCNKKAKRCRAGNPSFCADFPGQEAECVAALNQCCGFIGGKCDFGKAFRCCKNAGFCD